MLAVVQHAVHLPVLKLLNFAVVPILHRAVVTGDSAVNLGFASAMRACVLLACKITVRAANRVGGGDGIVGQLIILRNFANKCRRTLPIGQFFTEEGVEHRAGGIERLQLVLNIQRRENIFRIADGKM